MKKTYRLVKWYPSLPNRWKNNDNIIVEKFDDYYQEKGVSAGVPYYPIQIENEPEFWEEVIKKEFEILSIWNSNDSPKSERLFEKCSNGKFKWGGENYSEFSNYITGERLLEGEFNTIHSVKRLSDGEVFTLKDDIRTSASSCYCGIYGFKVIDGELIIDCTHSFLAREQGVNLLEDMQHIKKRLFTTSDGKDIFVGDTYWCVNTAPHLWSIWEQTSKERTELAKTVKAFSTEKLARHFLLENKPCLSYNDVMDVFKLVDKHIHLYLGDSANLKEIVKSNL